MLSLRHFNGEVMQSYQTIKGIVWLPSEPLQGPLIARVHDAWEVICGRAHAVRWPEKVE